MNPLRRLTLAVAAALGLATLAPAAFAAYPDKPVRVIFPFAAGGATDVWARSFTRRLTLKLGRVGLMFVVHPSVTARNMKEFIEQARGRKDWNLGTYAAGSTGAVLSQYLVATENLNLPVANYKGEAPAIADAVAGQIQGGLFSGQGVTAFVRGGRLKALGALANEHHPSFPDVPTLVEQGLTAMTHPGIWVGMLTAANTPADIINTLSQASQAVAAEPEFRKEWADLDIGVSLRGAKDFGQDIVGELAAWRDLVTRLGIKAE